MMTSLFNVFLLSAEICNFHMSFTVLGFVWRERKPEGGIFHKIAVQKYNRAFNG